MGWFRKFFQGLTGQIDDSLHGASDAQTNRIEHHARAIRDAISMKEIDDRVEAALVSLVGDTPGATPRMTAFYRGMSGSEFLDFFLEGKLRGSRDNPDASKFDRREEHRSGVKWVSVGDEARDYAGRFAQTAHLREHLQGSSTGGDRDHAHRLPPGAIVKFMMDDRLYREFFKDHQRDAAYGIGTYFSEIPLQGDSLIVFNALLEKGLIKTNLSDFIDLVNPPYSVPDIKDIRERYGHLMPEEPDGKP